MQDDQPYYVAAGQANRTSPPRREVAVNQVNDKYTVTRKAGLTYRAVREILTDHVGDDDSFGRTVERLRDLALEVAKIMAADSRADERAAVVAWLRAECGSPGHENRFCAYCNVRRNMADAIERGEHRRKKEP